MHCSNKKLSCLNSLYIISKLVHSKFSFFPLVNKYTSCVLTYEWKKESSFPFLDSWITTKMFYVGNAV